MSFAAVPPREFVVVVPAHNEVTVLPACLDALHIAVRRSSVPVRIVVVFDSCSDDSAALDLGNVHRVAVDARNVGAARAAGFRAADSRRASSWLVSTDADTTVDPDHFALLARCSGSAHAVVGAVRVRQWGERTAAVAAEYERTYADEERRGAQHVHGANLAVRADAYWKVGGIRPMAVHEDVDLVGRLSEQGFRVSSVGAPCVTTSARTDARVRGGFGSFLDEMGALADPA